MYEVTVYQNKIGICAFCFYRSNFCHLKKIYIFICVKTCHMMKKVKKQLGLRITEHQLSSYAPLSLRIAAFYKNSPFKHLCGYPSLPEDLLNK